MTDRIKDEANRILRDLGDEGALLLSHELRRRAHVKRRDYAPSAREQLREAMEHDYLDGSDEWDLYCYKAAASLASAIECVNAPWPWGHTIPVILEHYAPLDLIQEVLAEVCETERTDGPYDWDGNTIKDCLGD